MAGAEFENRDKKLLEYSDKSSSEKFILVRDSEEDAHS
jgi:hypothetical protein